MKIIHSLVLLITISFLACNHTTQPSTTLPLVAKTTVDSVDYTLSIYKTVFQLSDSLQLSFEVRNQSNTNKEFGFANQQQFGFKLTDSSGHVPLYYPSITQPAGSGFLLQPNQSKIFSMSWLFKDQRGNAIGRGQYQLSAYLTEGKSPQVTLQITVQ